MLNKLSVIFLVLVLTFSTSVFAQEWITMNQSTVSWDAVTEMQGGVAIPETDIIEYKIYLSNAITDPDKTNPAEIETVNATSYTITLVDEGSYFVGLQTVRSLADGTFAGESIIGWTDDPAIVLDGHTFGLRHFLPPLVPTGLRPGS